jgi:hypothetical protein
MPDYSLVMTAKADIHVDINRARSWFLNLKDHPERYAFDSHEGFTFIDGDFGEVGAQFYTIEHFRGIRTKLTFTITEVTPSSFIFEVTKPLRKIKGEFKLLELADDMTEITLSVFAPNNIIKRLFDVKPFYQAVYSQISGEVQHIKTSMENIA